MHFLTEPRRALQPKGTQWFRQIGLFVVQAISLGPCRRSIAFFTSSQSCRRFSKISNFQIHKVEKWKILGPFWQRVFFVIFHEHKDNFFWSVSAKTKVSNEWKIVTKLNHFLQKIMTPTSESPKNQWKNWIHRFYYYQFKKIYIFWKCPTFVRSILGWSSIHLTSKNAERWNNGYSFIKDFPQCVAGQIDASKYNLNLRIALQKWRKIQNQHKILFLAMQIPRLPKVTNIIYN